MASPELVNDGAREPIGIYRASLSRRFVEHQWLMPRRNPPIEERVSPRGHER